MKTGAGSPGVCSSPIIPCVHGEHLGIGHLGHTDATAWGLAEPPASLSLLAPLLTDEVNAPACVITRRRRRRKRLINVCGRDSHHSLSVPYSLIRWPEIWGQRFPPRRELGLLLGPWWRPGQGPLLLESCPPTGSKVAESPGSTRLLRPPPAPRGWDLEVPARPEGSGSPGTGGQGNKWAGVLHTAQNWAVPHVTISRRASLPQGPALGEPVGQLSSPREDGEPVLLLNVGKKR